MGEGGGIESVGGRAMRKKPMACGATATHLLLRPFHLLLLPFIHPLLFESYSHFTTIPTAPTRMMKARTRRVFLLARPIAFYWTSLYRVFFKKISFWRLLEGCRLFSIFFGENLPHYQVTRNCLKASLERVARINTGRGLTNTRTARVWRFLTTQKNIVIRKIIEARGIEGRTGRQTDAQHGGFAGVLAPETKRRRPATNHRPPPVVGGKQQKYIYIYIYICIFFKESGKKFFGSVLVVVVGQKNTSCKTWAEPRTAAKTTERNGRQSAVQRRCVETLVCCAPWLGSARLLLLLLLLPLLRLRLLGRLGLFFPWYQHDDSR